MINWEVRRNESGFDIIHHTLIYGGIISAEIAECRDTDVVEYKWYAAVYEDNDEGLVYSLDEAKDLVYKFIRGRVSGVIGELQTILHYMTGEKFRAIRINVLPKEKDFLSWLERERICLDISKDVEEKWRIRLVDEDGNQFGVVGGSMCEYSGDVVLGVVLMQLFNNICGQEIKSCGKNIRTINVPIFTNISSNIAQIQNDVLKQVALGSM
jgi:hypothetical protein